MICINCGRTVGDADTYCPYCGAYAQGDQGTILNGKKINTASYHDEDDIPSQGRFRQGHGLNLNGIRTKRTQRANINGTAESSPDAVCRVLAAVAYLGWIGYLIAFLVGRRHDPFLRFHMNQSIVLIITGIMISLLSILPVIGTIADVVLLILVFVDFLHGIIHAAKGICSPMPVLGKISVLK